MSVHAIYLCYYAYQWCSYSLKIADDLHGTLQTNAFMALARRIKIKNHI